MCRRMLHVSCNLFFFRVITDFSHTCCCNFSVIVSYKTELANNRKIGNFSVIVSYKTELANNRKIGKYSDPCVQFLIQP